MKVAIDSSVLIAILKGEPEFEVWRDFLIQLATEGNQIVACGVVWAEVSSTYPHEDILRRALRDQGIEFDTLNSSTCYLAGCIFREYRRTCKGPRERILADFIVGAHAVQQTGGLITNDEGFLRKYFCDLRFCKPCI